MVEQLRSLLENYLESGRGRSVQSLAQVAGVSYSTVRRILQGEVSTVALTNVLALLQAVTDWASMVEFLKAHFPDTGKYLEQVARNHSIAQNALPELMAAMLDFDSFVIVTLAATKTGTTRAAAAEVIGRRAEQAIDKLVADGTLLEAPDRRLHAAQENFACPSLPSIHAQLQHCLRFIRPEHVGQKKQMFGVHTNGVSREGQIKIHQAMERARAEIDAIAEANPGGEVIFTSMLMGTVS
jgi:hypothetical protein